MSRFPRLWKWLSINGHFMTAVSQQITVAGRFTPRCGHSATPPQKLSSLLRFGSVPPVFDSDARKGGAGWWVAPVRQEARSHPIPTEKKKAAPF
jgi:hypothetical protein